MSSWLRIVLVVGGVVVVGGAAAVIGASYWFDRNKDRLVAMGQRAKVEGEGFGAHSDADGCVHEALRRLHAASGVVAQLEPQFFLRECLRVAPRSEGFCAGVPSPRDFLTAASHADSSCTALGHEGEPMCRQLLRGVQDFCHEK